ncbi:MAG: alkylhydroperoxidase-related (seleno)protein [Gammaproteobacteria bacterium]
MSLYADSRYPVGDAYAALHGDELDSFARPGTWGTAAERTAIAAVARRARTEAGVQESVDDESLADGAELPAAARELAHRVALGGATIDREYFEQVRAAGLGEGAYVEIVGIVARLAHLDVFARGIGVPSRPLAAPTETHAPSRERPREARDEGFFVPSIPAAPAGGAVAESLYGKGPAANILRSLSLVADEARRLNRVVDTEYFSMATIFDLTHSSLEALSRPQIELVAARVSALNRCFY